MILGGEPDMFGGQIARARRADQIAAGVDDREIGFVPLSRQVGVMLPSGAMATLVISGNSP